MKGRAVLKGGGIVLGWGTWGGVYIHRGWTKRICLGWITITYLPVDFDILLGRFAQLSQESREQEKERLNGKMEQEFADARNE